MPDNKLFSELLSRTLRLTQPGNVLSVSRTKDNNKLPFSVWNKEQRNKLRIFKVGRVTSNCRWPRKRVTIRCKSKSSSCFHQNSLYVLCYQLFKQRCIVWPVPLSFEIPQVTAVLCRHKQSFVLLACVRKYSYKRTRRAAFSETIVTVIAEDRPLDQKMRV